MKSAQALSGVAAVVFFGLWYTNCAGQLARPPLRAAPARCSRTALMAMITLYLGSQGGASALGSGGSAVSEKLLRGVQKRTKQQSKDLKHLQACAILYRASLVCGLSLCYVRFMTCQCCFELETVTATVWHWRGLG